jgi:hypothetical protein
MIDYIVKQLKIFYPAMFKIGLSFEEGIAYFCLLLISRVARLKLSSLENLKVAAVEKHKSFFSTYITRTFANLY